MKAEGLQPKIIAPATRITMETNVLNSCKSSTGSTKITLQERDYVVGKTITTQR